MILDTNPSDDIVIVPPAPDFAFEALDEFTYSNLYCYDDGADALPTDDDNAAPSAEGNVGEGVELSNSTLSSQDEPTPASSASVFDSSFFDANNGGAADPSGNNKQQRRDPRNGAFTFQVHAEYDLLLHVQKDVDRRPDATDVELSKSIMRSVDEYCLRKQWMYHIGSEKGMAVGRFLREGAEKFHAEGEGGSSGGEVKKFICVELGTYCGYSALVLASTLRQFVQDLSSSEEPQKPFQFHIYTTEVSSKLLNVAQSVFRLAKMERHITPVLVQSDNDKDDVRPTLSRTLHRHGVSRIDFLLLDHAKHLYLDDLRDLEGAGLLRAGSRVGADNVVFNRLDAYREHVHALEAEGAAESRLEEVNLEYSNNLKDGMEMTVYLKDPPTR